MNIYAKQGNKVRCVKRECGFNDCNPNNNPLVVGEVYTVNYTNVGGWNTSVYLEEFPNMSFNSILFEDED